MKRKDYDKKKHISTRKKLMEALITADMARTDKLYGERVNRWEHGYATCSEALAGRCLVSSRDNVATMDLSCCTS